MGDIPVLACRVKIESKLVVAADGTGSRQLPTTVTRTKFATGGRGRVTRAASGRTAGFGSGPGARMGTGTRTSMFASISQPSISSAKLGVDRLHFLVHRVIFLALLPGCIAGRTVISKCYYNLLLEQLHESLALLILTEVER